MSSCCLPNDPCPSGIIKAACVAYTGANLSCLGVLTNDRLDVILEKINDVLCDTGSVLTFNNALTRTDEVVQLGGPLVRDTNIDFDGFELSLSNVLQDDESPFLIAQDANGNIKLLSADVFITEVPATTLPSTVAINGLNYTFDYDAREYTIKWGGELIENTTISQLNQYTITFDTGLNAPDTYDVFKILGGNTTPKEIFNYTNQGEFTWKDSADRVLFSMNPFTTNIGQLGYIGIPLDFHFYVGQTYFHTDIRIAEKIRGYNNEGTYIDFDVNPQFLFNVRTTAEDDLGPTTFMTFGIDNQFVDPGSIFLTMNNGPVNVMKIDVNHRFYTNQPSGNGAGGWKLGKLRAGAVALDTANYVEVEIDGVLYKLLKAS